MFFPNRRGSESAARAGLYQDVHKVSEDKRYPCGFGRQGINDGGWIIFRLCRYPFVKSGCYLFAEIGG